MIIDSRTVPAGTTIKTDLCIIGAGAAGITLAREFAGRSTRVCLLESGGLTQDPRTQALNAGENAGLPYFPLVAARLRYFGGTTNHWAGECRPLDEIDFEVRDWIPHSGWPFRRAELMPYYERAHALCQLGPWTYEPADWEFKRARHIPFPPERMKTLVFQLSPPTRFGSVYREELAQAANVSTYLQATILELETNADAEKVTRARVAVENRQEFWVEAKRFILAGGAIENARLLLASNRTQTAGLGNQHNLVGRFFMEHLGMESGIFLSQEPKLRLDFYPHHWVERHGVRIRSMATLGFSPEVMRREQIGNFNCELDPIKPRELEGVKSLETIAGSARRGKIAPGFAAHVRNIIVHIDEVLMSARSKVLKRPLGLARVINRSEQVPNPSSRVMLSDKRDRFNQPQARLEWRLDVLDRKTVKRGHELVGLEMGRTNLGRLKLLLGPDEAAWPIQGSWHHMGTTRMHTDPKQGVVNADCRIHGISNLYAAGSSVFPTSGSAPPTLTSVALALRLADHLKEVLA
ncbi:MAG: GMC family oxidoreductase [Candidatus Omnitrophica bacterium]|nr:GMC family oxidoreductase [Candidatus Omnitrophota bacterium]